MYLGDLIQRTFGELAAISPRRASRFEPATDIVEAATAETTVERPASIPMTVLPPFTPAEAVTHPAEPGDMPAVKPSVAPNFVPQDSFEVRPVGRIVTPIEATPSASTDDPPALPVERRESPNAPPNPAVTVQPIHTTTHEISRETVIREHVESRVENTTIERRLEFLVREPGVERIERIHAPKVQAIASPTPVARAKTDTSVRRTVTLPDARSMQMPTPPSVGLIAPTESRVVQVSIGRVEVRATIPAASPRPTPRNREPRLGLDDYLQKRERA